VRAVSLASYDIDQAIIRIMQQMDANYIGMPADQKFKTTIIPAEREKEIKGMVSPPDEFKGCGGFVRTYSAVCDYLGVPLQEDICWDLDNLYYLNEVCVTHLSCDLQNSNLKFFPGNRLTCPNSYKRRDIPMTNLKHWWWPFNTILGSTHCSSTDKSSVLKVRIGLLCAANQN